MRALVVGGGIGGLSAAIALRREGIETVVFERRTRLDAIQVGGGIHLWHNAMRSLGRLGLAERVQEVGSPVERAEFLSWRGGLLASWPVGDLGRKLGAPAIGVARPDLHPVLVGALESGALELGADACSFVQNEAGVTVRLADGREERGDLLVGADGIDSTIRAQLLGAAEPRYAGYSIWQAVVAFEHPLVVPGIFRVYWGRGSRFAYYHVGGNRLYWFGLMNDGRGRSDPAGGPSEMLQARFNGWPEPIAEILSATEETAISRLEICDRPGSERWGEGRATLLGDAAHAMTFNLGQGACQAIEDAALLPACLTATGSVADGLRAYEERRRRRTTPMAKVAWRLGAVGRWTNPVACALRNQLMKVTMRTFVLRKHERDMAREP